MRILKYAILGLINRQPMTGYDITKEFDQRVLANFWHAKHSQVYPELGKLIDEDLVHFEIVIQGEKLEKKLYTITEKGKKELLEWLVKDEPLEPTPKDVFRLRTYFSDFITIDQLRTNLKIQLDKHILKRDHLLHIMNTVYDNIPIPMTKEFSDYIILEGAILREDSYIEWLNRCLKYIVQN